MRNWLEFPVVLPRRTLLLLQTLLYSRLMYNKLYRDKSDPTLSKLE